MQSVQGFLVVWVITYKSGGSNGLFGGTPAYYGKWATIGSYQYQQGTSGVVYTTLESQSEACAKMGGTLVTWPSYKEYKAFTSVWITNIPNVLFMLGYVHMNGVATPSDMVSPLDDRPITWTPNPFSTDFFGQLEWCSQILISILGAALNDCVCSAGNTNLLCQKTIPFSSSTYNVRCSPLCRSQTNIAGHRFTTSFTLCGIGSTIENQTVGYAMTEYMPGISETMYEMRNQQGDTITAYASAGYMTALANGYSYIRSFIVATQPSPYTSLFWLMKSANSQDTLIVESGSPEYQTLLASGTGWLSTQSFYLFTDMNANYTCNFKKCECVWGAWQPWSVCSAPCGLNGTRQRIRQKTVVETTPGSCYGLNTTSETCQSSPCTTASESTTTSTTPVSTTTTTTTTISTTTTPTVTTTSTTAATTTVITTNSFFITNIPITTRAADTTTMTSDTTSTPTTATTATSITPDTMTTTTATPTEITTTPTITASPTTVTTTTIPTTVTSDAITTAITPIPTHSATTVAATTTTSTATTAYATSTTPTANVATIATIPTTELLSTPTSTTPDASTISAASIPTTTTTTTTTKFNQTSCGMVRDRSLGTVNLTISASSIGDCADFCAPYTWCGGVNFSIVAQKCELLNESANGQTLVCDPGWNVYQKI